METGRMIASGIMLAIALYIMWPPTLENITLYTSSYTNWISLALYFAIGDLLTTILWAVKKSPTKGPVQEPGRMVSSGIMLAVAVILMWLWPPTSDCFSLSIWIKLAVCFVVGIFYDLLTAILRALKKALCLGPVQEE